MNCNPLSLLNFFRIARFLRALAWLFIFPNLLSAQVFEATTETKEVALGSTIEVSFSLKDARGERFKAPDFPDFKIAGGPNEMRGMTIINGRSSSHQTWSYELEPKRTGTFTIAAASVIVDGKTLTTKPLTVKVVAAKAKTNVNLTPGSTDKLFITGEIDRSVAWLGQQLTWRIQLYTQLSLEGFDIIELPEFEGFYSKEKRRFDTRVTYQTVRGKKYAVKTLYEEALFPQETGDLIIDAAKLRVGIEQPGAFGVFLGSKPVVLQTQPIRLTVKPLPGPPPEYFSGGVGQYEWQVEVDRDSLSTDDALTLKISLRGNGDSKRFAVPKLTLPAGLEGFEPKMVEEEEYENGEEVVHTKVFEYVILPKEPGDYEITPALSFFDPDSNRFHTLTADSLPLIRVTAGTNYHPDQPALDTLPLPPPPAPTGFDGWNKITEWLQSPVLLSLLTLPVFLFIIFYLLKKRKPA
ncbi:MAG TPA: BatD family protein, partial [Saprospiraceae bacterium]|nr:BatD family protein [Saprospiraceae bacterium]